MSKEPKNSSVSLESQLQDVFSPNEIEHLTDAIKKKYASNLRKNFLYKVLFFAASLFVTTFFLYFAIKQSSDLSEKYIELTNIIIEIESNFYSNDKRGNKKRIKNILCEKQDVTWNTSEFQGFGLHKIMLTPLQKKDRLLYLNSKVFCIQGDDCPKKKSFPVILKKMKINNEVVVTAQAMILSKSAKKSVWLIMAEIYACPKEQDVQFSVHKENY